MTGIDPNGFMNEMMPAMKTENICANCGHKGKKKIAGNGNEYWEHDPHITMGIAESHAFICPCKKFVPQNQSPETKNRWTHKKTMEEINKTRDNQSQESYAKNQGDALSMGGVQSAPTFSGDNIRGIFDTAELGCNKNLGRGLCGDISFANKIILCDDCVFKLIEKQTRLKAEVEKIIRQTPNLHRIGSDNLLELKKRLFG